MAWCRVDDIAAVPNAWATAWLAALVTGVAAAWIARSALNLNGSRRGPAPARHALHAAGFAIVAFPAWRYVLAVAPDLVRTFCARGDLAQVIPPPPGGVLPQASLVALSNQTLGLLLGTLGYIAAGAILLAFARDPGLARAPSTRRLARALAPMVPLGQGEARSAVLGAAAFPVLAVANLALLWALGSARTADDSPYFAGADGVHVLLLPLAAAVAEELLYRVVLQRGTTALLGGGRIAWIAGFAVQAIVFAYAHAGYQELVHLLFAFLFAALAGLVVQAYGIWCAIALHALIDAAAMLLAIVQHHGWHAFLHDPLLVVVPLAVLGAVAAAVDRAVRVGPSLLRPVRFWPAAKSTGV